MPRSAAGAAGGPRTATGTPHGGAVAAAPHAASGENRERHLTTSRRFEAWGGSEAGESWNWKSRLGAGMKIKEGLQVRDYNFDLHFFSSPFSLNKVFRQHQWPSVYLISGLFMISILRSFEEFFRSVFNFSFSFRCTLDSLHINLNAEHSLSHLGYLISFCKLKERPLSFVSNLNGTSCTYLSLFSLHEYRILLDLGYDFACSIDWAKCRMFDSVSFSSALLTERDSKILIWQDIYFNSILNTISHLFRSLRDPPFKIFSVSFSELPFCRKIE